MNVKHIETQTTTCGCYLLSSDYDISTMIHCHYRIYYLLDGSLVYRDKNVTKTLIPGAFYLLPDRTPYSLSIPEECKDQVTQTIIFFVISEPCLCSSIAEFLLEDNEILKSYAPFMNHIAEDSNIGQGENKYSMLMQNSVNILFNLMNVIKPFNITYDDGVARAIQYINDNLNTDLSNEVLAKVALTSKSNFIKQFTNQVKKTPQKYVLDIRMTTALKLLNENYKVREICDMVGYESISSFNRAFKKLFGRTPTKCILNLYRT